MKTVTFVSLLGLTAVAGLGVVIAVDEAKKEKRKKLFISAGIPLKRIGQPLTTDSFTDHGLIVTVDSFNTNKGYVGYFWKTDPAVWKGYGFGGMSKDEAIAHAKSNIRNEWNPETGTFE